MTTMQQAIHQADLVVEFLCDEHPVSRKGTSVGDVSGWTAEPILEGRAKEWTNPVRPNWKIYEQPAGFYVWRGFKFAGENETLQGAVARVENRVGGVW